MPLVVPSPANDDAVARQRFYQAAAVPTTEFNGIAPAGALCLGNLGTAPKLYINTGTKAANTWTVVGAQT